ncbi:hypothetical protein VTK73DRAFT_7650 [Phialemonium thermophilum]|uniref:DUF7905 domain-containing protein n=1 Tax=Phialemonium thermophilum TaxID=223376 RepID=A0ABR3Y6E7_9PEZI
MAMPTSFSEAPRENESKVNLKVLLPTFGYKEVDPDDIDLMTVLRQIEGRHDVRILQPKDDGVLSIYAKDVLQAQAAAEAIRVSLVRDADEQEIWHPMVLALPPSTEPEEFQAKLERAVDGVRLVALPKFNILDWRPEIRDAQLCAVEYRKAFQDKISLIVSNLRSSPNEMRMRVQFGVLRLQEWRKNKDIYFFNELKTATQRTGLRGTYKFSELVGSAQFAAHLLDIVVGLDGLFDPLSPRISCLEDVQPKHHLIFRTAALDLEMEIIAVLDNDQSRLQYRPGPIKAYRRQKRSRSVEIVTSCPQLKHDWRLEVRARENLGSVPFTQDDISRSMKFAAAEGNDTFPRPFFPKDFVAKYRIEGVQMRTFWAYRLKNTPYEVEISLYHGWPGPTNTPSKAMGCGISMKGMGWDDELDQKNIADGLRDWSDDLKELFPQNRRSLKTDDDGLAYFLRCVGCLHGLVDKVCGMHIDDESKEEQE